MALTTPQEMLWGRTSKTALNLLSPVLPASSNFPCTQASGRTPPVIISCGCLPLLPIQSCQPGVSQFCVPQNLQQEMIMGSGDYCMATSKMLCSRMESRLTSANAGIWSRAVLGPAIVAQQLSHVRLFATETTAAHQASLSFTISQSLL